MQWRVNRTTLRAGPSRAARISPTCETSLLSGLQKRRGPASGRTNVPRRPFDPHGTSAGQRLPDKLVNYMCPCAVEKNGPALVYAQCESRGRR